MKMRKNSILLLFALCCSPWLSLSAQEDDSEGELREMNFEELQKYAGERNHQVRVARKEVDRAKKDVQATTAIGLPQVQATGSYENFIDRPTNLIPAEFFGGRPGEFAEVQFGTEHNATYRLEGQQLLFDGSYFVGLQASKTYKRMAQERVEKNEEEVMKMVGDAYINTLAAREELRSLRSTIGNLRKLYEETNAMFEEGLTPKEERDQLKRTVLNMENSISSAEQQAKASKRSLKLLAGMPSKDSLVLKDSLKGILEKNDGKELLSERFHPEEHVDHRIASTQVQLEELNKKNERADFYPELNAFFNYQENAQRDEFNIFDGDETWYPQTVAGVRVTVPIFNGGRKLFQTQKAEVARVQAEIERERVDEELLTDYNNAKDRFRENLARYENQEEAMRISGGILERTIEKHREGTASSLEVTQTKNQYLDDRRAYLRSVQNLLQARNELEKILGRY